MTRRHPPLFIYVAAIFSSWLWLPHPHVISSTPWQTPYKITFNYTMDQPDPASASSMAKQKMYQLLDHHFHTPWLSELAPVRRRTHKRRELGLFIGPDAASSSLQPHEMLIMVTTSNVWLATEQLLVSLAALTEPFDLLVVDECSSDGTRQRLAELGIPVVHVNSSQGVTHNWNLGYQRFLAGNYTYFVIANNDVLVPPGVLTNLKRAMDRGCDLVSPLSTVNGKGHVGLMEGFEAVYNLTVEQANKMYPASMFAKVQAALDIVYADGQTDPIVTRNPVFNGFFFAVHKRIKLSAAVPGEFLFSPELGILHQEKDLNKRMKKTGQRKCLDLASFVYHHKASTIPQGTVDQRIVYKAACEAFAE